MIVSSELFLPQIHDAVKHDTYVSEEKQVHILVANNDVDALAASEQLQAILLKEDINYALKSVETYEEVQAECEAHFSDVEDYRTLILVNCGATEDVRSLCGIDAKVRIVIIDSHRPVWHGYNKHDDTINVVVVDDDDPVKREDVPEYIEEDEERAARNDASSSDGEDEGSEEEGDENADVNRPRKRQKQDRDAKRKAFMERQQRIVDYYTKSSGYGKPSALLLYQLAHHKQMDASFFVWCAILGLTDQLLNQRVDKADYERWRVVMEGHVAALGSGADDQEGDPAGVSSRTCHHRANVVKCEDLRLTLYRHWNVLDAMTHTSYIAAKLQTWREKGKQQLLLLLAKMNFINGNQTAHFSQLKPYFKDRLPDSLKKNCASFFLNYEQLRLSSFELQYKADVRLTASEHCLALSALLSRPRGLHGAAPTAHDFFLEAANAINVTRHDTLLVLRAGLERAKSLAKYVVTEGGLAMTRSQVHGGRSSPMWLLNLAELEFGHREDFHHPAMLQKLALFVRDAMTHRTARRGEQPKPKATVIIGPPNEEDTCFVVAVRQAHKAGTMQNNPFARPFQEVMDELDTPQVSVSFDTSLFCIKRAQASAFLEELRNVIAVDYDGGA